VSKLHLFNGQPAIPRQATIYPWCVYRCVVYKVLIRDLGAFQSLAQLELPDPNSPIYQSLLLYKARAHIAIGDADAVAKLVPSESENVALKAVSALATYVSSPSEDALEELRDLSVEIDGDEVEGSEEDKATVRVLAGTAFARAGEIEEALETLGSDTEDLEAYVCYPSFTAYTCS
jgi:coatomer subunit epsilon